MKRIIALLLAAAAILGLAGCQATPERDIVTSKNDGAFESALEATAAPAAEGTQQTGPATVYEDAFDSADGSASYALRVTEPAAPAQMPVLRVRPAAVSAQDAKDMAQALLGQTEMYEYTYQRSRAEIEQVILQLRQELFDFETRAAENGLAPEDVEIIRGNYADAIAGLEQAYDAASDQVQPVPCQWEFHPGSYYADPSLGTLPDNGSQNIRASATVDGMPYVYAVTLLDGDDYRQRTVGLYLDTERLTDGQIEAAYDQPREGAEDTDAIRARALEMAQSLGRGQWRVLSDNENAYWSEYASGGPGLVSTVTLTRDCGTLPVAFHLQTDMEEDSYASNYSYESLTFAFNGELLLSMEYHGMLDVAETVSQSVQTLPFDQVVRAAEDHMRVADISRFLDPIGVRGVGVSIEDMADCTVRGEADGVELGLSRVLMKDSNTDYYLVPSYTFYGTVTVLDSGGEPLTAPVYDDDHMETGREPVTMRQELAVINAVDGSVIDVNKGY